MKIHRLRLTGFKSFVEPTELRIEPGLTGVVGPNGCGKSNLLEAIRWVMGESSPKSMRGGGMDDVIFAGTQSRPPRDFAEVALVCEVDGATSPTLAAANDGGALEVVRRIERGAGSAYRANGHDVRARDVALIFADAATGAHSPALVSQGKVAGIIAAKPQERRMLLEEAAGIAGLHVRRKEAEQKLRATETNLARLSDILADMDNRAAALRRQARAAERYIRLTDQIRVAEGRMIFARWRDAAAAADAARAEATSAGQRVDDAQVEMDAASVNQAQAMATLASARDAATTGREAEHRLSSALAEQRSARHTLERRIADLAAEAERIARDHDAEDALAREGASAIERLELAGKANARQMAEREKDRAPLESRLSAAADVLRDNEVALAGARAEAANEAAERRIAEAALNETNRRLARADADLARLDAEMASSGDGGALAAAAAAARQRYDGATAIITDHESTLTAAAAARATTAAAIAPCESAVAEARSALSSVESEISALARSIGAGDTKQLRALDALRVLPGYETAVAAALGDDLSAPVIDGNAGEGRGWRGAAIQTDDPALPHGAIALVDLVDGPAALTRRLKQVGVVDADAGQPLHVGQRLVTRDGHMRRWDGFVSQGDGAAAADRLERVNRLAALESEAPGLRAALSRCEAQAQAARAAHDAADAAMRSAQAALSSAEDEARQARRAADNADAALERYQAAATHLAERREAALAERAIATADGEEAARALAALPDGSATALRMAELERATAAAREAQNALRLALGDVERDVASLREAAIEGAADLRGWKARAGEAARRIAQMTERRSEIARELDGLTGRPAALDGAIATLEADLASATAAVSSALADERAAGETLKLAEQRLEAAREALASAREARAGAAARAENAEGRRIEMGRISGERFACPPPLLPDKAGFDEGDVSSPAEEGASHERLSADRERIGPVNLVAAQELAELEAEQATSAAESAELAQAVNQLRGSIGHLNREGRQRLTEAFEKVDGHFQRLFTTLFGGGQAHLAMVESDDPLEAGLEIMAQPPGKRLSTLTLLSGGEQALTAIALIFALFLTNPAPICVLDEVDAPLDDANVERFCNLLDAMVAETATRYLIVTHNAVTMSRMHRLFGVTMVERGVSRLVSVDLGAAEELLAAE